MLATQLKYDLIMFSRELFYLIFSIIVPPVTYIFMGQLFGEDTYAGGLSYVEMYTPSFIILITFSVVFFAFGFDQVMNRSTGVEKRIGISPVPQRTILLSGIIKSIIITSFGFVLIHAIGMVVYNLTFNPITFLVSYGFFILLNAVLLVISSAVYSLFRDLKSALIFSILIFQVVMFTGDFSLPVAQMPTFIQVIANINPMYHVNHLFIDVWNSQLIFNNDTWTSIGVIMLVFVAALIVIRWNRRKV
ncbi:ABC transporter permease [Oceanobacillus piezotolerans]|uniref:ABC transporter permease n=1 Tax=Oceanobacillus piezotolerans TaxID=2448030 RepID=A0A498D3V4_9BACI|nr:ABC transporter permease [Oceanobacillus piezotolerans]RLL42882.1 ABC transporter permease [Oceanobacillus piezotolerans]